jgi:hypothetical protein
MCIDNDVVDTAVARLPRALRAQLHAGLGREADPDPVAGVEKFACRMPTKRPAHPARTDSPVPAADSDGQEDQIPNQQQVMRFLAFLAMNE